MTRTPKKGKSSPIADFIRSAVDAKYKRRAKAAEDFGIHESFLSRICSGNRPGVSEEIIEKICNKLGLDKSEGVLNLILTRHENVKKFFANPPKPIPFRIIHSGNTINPEAISGDYTPVPVVPMNDLTKAISIGHRAKEHVLIPAEMAPKDRIIKCCRSKGDSMAPTLQDGSLVAVDLEEKEPQHDSLFLINWKEKIMVRRIKLQDGYLLFCPDNKDKYPIEVYLVKRVNTACIYPIIGKIVWSMERF